MDVIFTIVSRNYAAQAATLMQGLAEHEPAARRVVVAADGPIPQLSGLCEVIAAGDLGAPVAGMSVYYDALELNTAVKPFVMRALLAEPGVDSVTYLDPDIEVFAPLDAVREGLDWAQVCLTPHRTAPLIGDGAPSQADLDRSGKFNLGFLAVRDDPQVFELLDWWAERCRFDCRVDFDAGLFVDQKWMDEAPDRVETVAVLAQPTLNLAYWNLDLRALSREDGEWRVDGQPLVFFHFSGFDPRAPRVLSKHQNRIAADADPVLSGLLAHYAERLAANGYAEAIGLAYAHAAFPDGRKVTPLMRRTALTAARAGHAFEGLTPATSAWFDADERPGVTRLLAQAAREHAGAGGFDQRKRDGRAALARWALDNAAALGLDDRSRAAIRIDGDADAGVAARFARDPQGLLAWRLGPETLAGRFSAEGIAADEAILEQAADFALIGRASRLKRRLFLAFGLAWRWPEALRAPLQAEWLQPWVGRPAPFVRLFQAIWEARPDLRRPYPLTTAMSRFRFLRWLLAGGLAEYGVEALPDRLARRPSMRLARWTLR